MTGAPLPALDNGMPMRGRGQTSAILLLLGLPAGLLVVFDPILSNLLPTRWWILVGAEDWPIRLTPIVLLGLLALVIAIRSELGYFVLFVASLQMNGLRLGPIDPVDLTLSAGVIVLAARLVNQLNRPVRLGIVGNAAFLLVLIALPHIIVQGSVVRFGLGWIGLIRAFLIAFLLMNLIETREQLSKVIRIFIMVAVLSAAIGIIQFAASFLAGINFTLIDPPESAFKPTPIGMVMRSSGLCITAQHQSGFLILALPFALWRASTSWKATDLAAAGLVCIGILVTWNMGAVLVAVAAFGTFILFRWPRYTIQILVAAILSILLLYYFGVLEWIFDQVFNAGVVKGASQRGTLLELGLEKLDRNILVGTGPQGFATFSGNFWGRPVHNAYLQIATELGLVAMLVFTTAMLALLTALVLTLKRVRDLHDRATLLCMIMAQGILIAIMMSEPMMDHSNTWFALAIVQVSIFVFSTRPPEVGEQSRTTPSRFP